MGDLYSSSKKPRKDGLKQEPKKDTYFRLPLAPPEARRNGDGTTTTPYERHRALVKDYLKFYSSAKTLPTVDGAQNVNSELSILKQHHTFLREEDAVPEDGGDHSWEARIALKYYNALYKEYALGKFGSKGRLALRWRSKAEVVAGKGQFICGSLDCSETKGLASYEVLFVYMESVPASNTKEKKSALVKLRVCPSCAETLKAGRRGEKKTVSNESSSSVVAIDPAASVSTESLKRKRSEAGVSVEETGTRKEHELDPSAIWSHPTTATKDAAEQEEEQDEELSRDREFDSYFADLLK